MRPCMVCRTDADEAEINFLCYCEENKDLILKFIRYLEINEHRTHFVDSDNRRGIFQSTNTNILLSFGKFIVECYCIHPGACNVSHESLNRVFYVFVCV